MRALTALGSSVVFAMLLAALPAPAEEGRLSLVQAVRQALESNPDLASQQRALAADREAIGIARSPLLPQVVIGGRAQVMEDDRADDKRGAVSSRSAAVAAEISQVLYDEKDWASYQVQKYTFDQQQQQFESFRLSLIQDAAGAYFELDRSLALVRIQQENREATRESLETTRARVAAGWSSERELLRWDAQLAGNDTDVERALVQSLADRFELNRVRNRSREAPVDPIPATVDAHGFFYARQAIAKAASLPEGDRKLRDYLVRVGLARSPTLRAIDASIAAQERVQTASQRAFWVPSLSVGAGVDHLFADNSGDPNLQETEWGARAQVVFPLFEGGAKFASLRQAGESLESLRLDRGAQANSLDGAIRTAFAQASGAYRTLAYSKRQSDAAQKNYELVYDAYVLGVADYLDLLDAQSETLTAQIASMNALYDFFRELLAAEEQIAFFPFLEDPEQVSAMVGGLARELGVAPSAVPDQNADR